MQTQTTGKLNILAAVYGLKSVTNNIAALVTDDDLQKLSFTVNNKVIGEDGWKGQRKSLTILYNYDDGAALVATAKESEVLTIGSAEFAKSKALTKHISFHKEKVTVLAATYGTDDITYKVKNLISSYNTISFKADNTVFGDGWYGVAKTLVVILGYDNNVSAIEVFTERENCYIDLNDVIATGNALAAAL